ncbi:hypothetical protein NDI56_20785 [Haloarcula sp. S1CR25-12]|uniref:Resolvase HTH domain-containing protein n=1 Tax=Haloarcula saliterrae TaxID=2950534 RepID=A0ABU2FHV7_9EURY|nr:hypothetical protein [Haloarcula sp. S1CR25-12]MDS0261844.1 hypothetical protein [Haloarcula sp. S1CR25-12]
MTDRTYLRAALKAGFEVADLAKAHDVSKKSIYRAIDRHDLTREQPQRNGAARWLWNAPPDTVLGDD